MATSLVQVQPEQIPVLTEQQLRIKQSIEDPVLFSKTFLNTECWNIQSEILSQLNKPYARVAVKACHSSSKTFTAAIAALWFLARYTESIVVTTAPTWNQVRKLLWGEIHSALSRSIYPFPEASQTELNFLSKGYPKRYAQGLATTVNKEDEGVKFQGYHAAHVLYILDEAPGIDPKLWEAMEGSAAGGDVRFLAIGNPTISGGPFHKIFTEERSGWKCFTISAFITPNFEGVTLEQLISKDFPDETLDNNPLTYLITKRWVRNQYYKWGPSHPFWESRVLGQFPSQNPDALLSLSWLEEAKNRELHGKGELSAGIDVAGPGEAETSLTVRDGPEIILHKQWEKSDPRGELVFELNPLRSRLKTVNVDSIGIGWGLYLHLKDLKFPAVPINICETSSDSEQFADCKAEYYWGLRLRAQQGDLSGLIDEETIGQLASIRWKPNSRGQIEIESKEDARKRGVPSPDRAESVMLAFATRNMVYGVLEYNKMQKAQLSQLQKPVTVDQQLECPNCKSTSVSKAQGQWICTQCLTQWGDRPRAIPSQQSRNDVLMKSKSRNW